MNTIIAILAALAPAIQDGSDARRREIVELFKRSDLARNVARLQQHKLALAEARIEAIGAIADRKTYTKHAGQREVDARVAAVRKIWTDPGPAMPRLSEKWSKLLAELKILGIPENDPFFAVIALLDQGPLSFRETPLEFEEPGLVERNREARKFNATVRAKVGKNEWALVEELNDYREMMGRPRLMISVELTRAARSHSAEMKAASALDHGDFAKRAADFGFAGRLVGENILLGAGSPTEAHRIWYGSAPHHRNMLVERYTHIGVGAAGEYWTEMFGKEE